LGFRLPDELSYAENGNLRLQRLYSTFARGWPGAGLVCLRIVGATAAFHCALTALGSRSTPLWAVLEGAAGVLLCAGLWTPIGGIVLSVLAVWSAFSGNGDLWAHILLATMGAALAMLGPGAWSIDARLFGRKRLIRER
jgi:putative oxidoreductase